MSSVIPEDNKDMVIIGNEAARSLLDDLAAYGQMTTEEARWEAKNGAFDGSEGEDSGPTVCYCCDPPQCNWVYELQKPTHKYTHVRFTDFVAKYCEFTIVHSKTPGRFDAVIASDIHGVAFFSLRTPRSSTWIRAKLGVIGGLWPSGRNKSFRRDAASVLQIRKTPVKRTRMRMVDEG